MNSYRSPNPSPTHTTTTAKHSKALGFEYEQIAANYLSKQGLYLIDMNFTSRFGEIDLIMTHRDTLVFIEIKFRKYAHYGTGLESITRRKQKKIITTAHHYLNRMKQFQGMAARFDVLAIEPQPSPNSPETPYQFHWIENAFDLAGGFSCL